MTNKELDILACKTFVCPNLSLIEEKGKELRLRDATIKRAKDMAIDFFKKTYHKPPYSSALFPMPSFVYIASVLEHERRYQMDVATVFGVTSATINRWNKFIIEILEIDMMPYKKSNTEKHIVEPPKELEPKRRYIKRQILDLPREFICPDLSLIDKIGKELELRDDTIAKAKELGVRYFKATYMSPCYTSTDDVLSALIYSASIVNKDYRRQMDISMVTHVNESYISKYHKDIIETLRIKIIFRHDNTVLSVSEGL